MDDDRAMTNPALDLAARGNGQWWGIAALVAAIAVAIGAAIASLTDSPSFAGTDSITTAWRLQYAINELALVPVLLTVVALLVERSRLLPFLAAGIWSAAQVVEAVSTFADSSNLA